MQPPDASLVVTLENATRADAPAVAHASSSMRLGSGPPYAWRLTYDTALGGPQQLNLRAQITTPAGLWMSTDTWVSAASSAAPLRLRLVAVGAADAEVPGLRKGKTVANAKANADDLCASATTQADMTGCAQEDFEAASNGYGQRYSELSKPMPSAQRDRLLRMQSAWLKFRTEACRYESGPSSGGSVQTLSIGAAQPA